MNINTYTNYNYWANDLVLSLVDKNISEEGLDKVIISSFPSLRKTIYHIWDAEFIWLNRLKGDSLSRGPGSIHEGNFSSAMDHIFQIDRKIIHFVENLGPGELSASFTYQNIEGKTFTNPVWQSILHCVNHSTYHRGQIVTMLRQLDQTSIPSTDFITFCRI